MTSEVLDWDSSATWNIGEPQPELTALIAAGNVKSEVLDAGCGTAALSLMLADNGYRVVGLDISPSAIAAANHAAQTRNLTTAAFAQVDLTSLHGYDGRFNTVIDGGLYHSLPGDARHNYLHAVQRASAPGGVLHMLVPAEHGEDELRRTVSAHWSVDEIRPAVLHGPDRTTAPALLLSAHK